MLAPGVGEVRLGFGDLREARRDRLVGGARVDAREHLPGAHGIACLDAELDDASGDLRAERRLLHGLDDAFGGDRLREVADRDLERLPDARAARTVACASAGEASASAAVEHEPRRAGAAALHAGRSRAITPTCRS